MKSKKASINDAVYVPIYLLIIIATAFIALYVWLSIQNGMTDMINNAPTGTGNFTLMNQSIQGVFSTVTSGLTYVDYMMPFIVGVSLLVSLIFAFKTGSSVVYAFLSILFWGFALLMSAVYTNVFEQFASAFPTIATSFPISVYIMANLKWVVLSWVFLISVVMFTRSKKEEEAISAQEMAWGG